MPSIWSKVLNQMRSIQIDKIPDHIMSKLTPNQKRMVKRIISDKRRDQIRDLLSNNRSRDVYTVENIKYKLFNLGFNERARIELENIVSRDEHAREIKRRLAARALILWHGNQYSEESARLGLDYIRFVRHKTRDRNELRQLVIMEAEFLSLIAQSNQARSLIMSEIESQPHEDLYLALSNLSDTVDERVSWINKALELQGISPISLSNNADHRSLYDRLASGDEGSRSKLTNEQPKVTVIVPVYNSEMVINTAIDSIRTQSWANLEIIIVDDCSTDHTWRIIREYAAMDPRIKVLRTDRNSGPYVARNIALKNATGDFVTCHDADDWSHHMKIETQVKHLLNHPKIVGNMSLQARMSDQMHFNRRGKFGLYIFSNMSSFMFRRQMVLDKIGYWDSVRFGADSEFIRRIKNVFGEQAIVDVPNSLLSFQRYTESSLTGDQRFGYNGFFTGARKEYFESYQYFFSQIRDTNSYKYEYPQENRRYSIPRIMSPVATSDRKHYDVIIVSDFRLRGGSTLSSLEEIKAQHKMGITTGLIQLCRYDYDAKKRINPKIRDLLNEGYAEMITHGEKVSCDVLIVRYPPILQEKQLYKPDVIAEKICVIVNQTPKSDYGENGQVRYDISRCHQHLSEWIDAPQVWYPIGPLVRDTLYRYHKEDLEEIKLSDEDWVNIIDVDEWWMQRPSMEGRKPIIGRHSRDEWVKWPATKQDILTIYPNTQEIEVRILGGTRTLARLLGRIPRNWKVYEFGELEPKQFLGTIDIFVYYTHPDWVESFGRVIIEAMASGVPVVLPPVYKPLFGGAAIYADMKDVRSVIERLVNDREYYVKQVELQKKYIEKHFGYKRHETRVLI